MLLAQHALISFNSVRSLAKLFFANYVWQTSCNFQIYRLITGFQAVNTLFIPYGFVVALGLIDNKHQFLQPSRNHGRAAIPRVGAVSIGNRENKVFAARSFRIRAQETHSRFCFEVFAATTIRESAISRIMVFGYHRGVCFPTCKADYTASNRWRSAYFLLSYCDGAGRVI